ncbi:MAG: hypothetical protein ACOYD4_02945 [Solirubrobacterales bacterium]
MRLKIILGSVLVVAVVVAGCGGGDSSGGTSAGGTGAGTTSGGSETGPAETTGNSGSGKPLTKKEFIAKGDAICGEIPAEYEVKRQEVIKAAPKKATTEEINLKAAVPPIFTAVEAMEELTPPKGEEAEVEAIIAALEAAGKGLEEEPTAPLVGPKSPYAEFQELTKAYGLNFCSQL